ncbi:unnamed protein product [Periconia digitata]|uniref:C2H2-type domain-containing protein n=1 Tax=Periconia digitata TaxID=1303443 RepID=A0A9W4UBU0_9PLEO|nr:unnamed protein product [Periconia digitata]
MASPCAFQDAIRNFKSTAGLTQAELRDFSQTSLDDLKQCIATIQNDQRASRKLRYLKRLGPFLDTMERYGKIIEVFLNVSDIIAFVWGPVKFLLMVTKECAEIFNILLDAYHRIGETIPQFQQYQTLFVGNTHVQRALGFIYEDILNFHKEALRYFRKSAWRQLFEAARKMFSENLKQLENDLSRHTALIDRQASLEEYSSAQAARLQSQQYFEEARAAELDRRRTIVQQWLGSTAAQTRHDSHIMARHPCTGDWLFRDPRFQKWFDFDYCIDPILWLNGIPGAGKTILASTIIEHSHRLPQAKICFFYCRSTDVDHHAFVRIARAMLSQLMVNNNQLTQLLYDHVTKSSEAMLSSESAAQSLLQTAFNSCDKSQKIYIIIDGLDECNRDERKMITTWFKTQVQNIPSTDLGMIRCLFVSQDDGYARKDLSDCASIKLTPEDTRQDIDSFCKMWQTQIAEKFKPFNLQAHDIATIVASRSQGMFLYARLVTWNLYSQPNRQSVYDELHPDILPPDLDKAYARIIDRVMGSSVQHRLRGYAEQVLGWLVCAKRTLRWREIQGAVSVDMVRGTMNRDLELQDECKDLLASLVERSVDDSVNLVHSTAKRYLIQNGYINTAKVESEMAHLCLTYMSFDHFHPLTRDDQVRISLHKGDYAFADYASSYWANHLIEGVRDAGKSPTVDLRALIEAIGVFLDVQRASRQDPLVVSKTLQTQLAPLEYCSEYQEICQAVVSTKNQLLPTGKGPLKEEVLHIAKVMGKWRSEIELVFQSVNATDAEKQSLELFYGPHPFKCSRLNCRFYHEGFELDSQRKLHNDKHERAFLCTKRGCPWETIGYTSSKELRAHTKECHEEPEYPEEDDEERPSANRKAVNRFQCTLCPKRFTRAYNLRAHMRVHTDERPYVCSVCGMAFARHADRARHEGLHSGERKFICRGSLQDGSPWGCGRRFTRADALGRHFRSEAGRICIQPLLKEEAQKKGDWIPNGQQETTNNGMFGLFPNASSDPMQTPSAYDNSGQPLLPATLLAQYPALATMDWNSMSLDVPDEDNDATSGSGSTHELDRAGGLFV